ncbi:MAG: uracil-DNA glycosylase [Planctomycetes bacterium]|nr:uracil-DNA glycosylase [Planctomycetota bacterium]
MAAERLRIRLESDRMFGVDFARRGRPRRAPAPSPPPPENEAPAPGELAPADAADAAGPAGPAADASGSPADRLADLGRRLGACSKCKLSWTRRTVVAGEGSPTPELVFVGEAPGADEDRQGRPFVGKAGQLLTKMIEAMGFARGDVYIANVLKCRPPENRDPAPDEVAACLPALREQIEILKPKVIVALGGHAYHALTGGAGPGITAARGKFTEYGGVPLMPTFHPAYLLRNEGEKRKAWEDMKKVLAKLGRKAPGK